MRNTFDHCYVVGLPYLQNGTNSKLFTVIHSEEIARHYIYLNGINVVR